MASQERSRNLAILLEPAVLVKPCVHAPPHTLYLSNLDILYNYYNAIAFFYPPSPHKSSQGTAGVLKEALQQLLVRYPWAAGRLRSSQKDQRLEVYCNAQGAQFVSASSQLRFADLGDVSDVNPALDSLYASVKCLDDDSESLPLVAFQVTRFSCGGFVIGLKANHVLFDGYSAAVFIKNLCSLARSSELCVPPDVLERKQRIAPRNPLNPTSDQTCFTAKGDVDLQIGRARKFSFSEETLELLRRRALSQNGVLKCSRFVALAAHLWMAKAKTLETESPEKEFTLAIPVNFREKLGSAIPSSYMGNAIIHTIAKASVKDLCDQPLSFAVGKIQEALGMVTWDYVQSNLDLIESLGCEASLTAADLRIPSLAALPFYDADCGWGKPIYVGRPCKQFTDGIVVLSGEAECRSYNILAVCESEEERSRFANAIQVMP